MFFKKRDASLHFKMRRVEMVIKIQVLVKPVLYTIFLQTCHRFRSGFTFVCFLFRFNPAHIRRKNPVFDGRVLIDLGTYQSLDEGQREILKENGLAVNIVTSQ